MITKQWIKDRIVEGCNNPQDYAVTINVNNRPFVSCIHWLLGEGLMHDMDFNTYHSISGAYMLDGTEFSW